MKNSRPKLWGHAQAVIFKNRGESNVMTYGSSDAQEKNNNTICLTCTWNVKESISEQIKTLRKKNQIVTKPKYPTGFDHQYTKVLKHTWCKMG